MLLQIYKKNNINGIYTNTDYTKYAIKEKRY